MSIHIEDNSKWGNLCLTPYFHWKSVYDSYITFHRVTRKSGSLLLLFSNTKNSVHWIYVTSTYLGILQLAQNVRITIIPKNNSFNTRKYRVITFSFSISSNTLRNIMKLHNRLQDDSTVNGIVRLTVYAVCNFQRTRWITIFPFWRGEISIH